LFNGGFNTGHHFGGYHQLFGIEIDAFKFDAGLVNIVGEGFVLPAEVIERGIFYSNKQVDF